MTIGSLMSRMGTAEKLSIPQIQQAIKDGTLPAYVGIPMLQDKLKQQQAMRSAQAQAQQQPPIADQVMAEANAEEAQGVGQLPTNLPARGYAPGGIVAFASGGDTEDEDEDETQDKYDMAEYTNAMDDAALAGLIMAKSDKSKPQFSSFVNKTSEEAKETKEPIKGKHKFHEQIVSAAEQMGLNPEFALRIAGKETGGLKNPEAAVSPAGALGVMQLMPKTAMGLGVKDPLNPEQNIHGGVRYAKQMLDKYGDEKLAAMAYNWGPGNVDKWLAAGKGIDALPRETRNYAAAFAEGGAVKHFVGGGISDIFSMSPSEAKDYAQRLLRMNQARSAFGAAPAAVEAAGAATAPGFLESAASALGKFNPAGVVGWGSLFHSPELNQGEEAELARIWAKTKEKTPQMPVTASNTSGKSYTRGANEAATRATQAAAGENAYTRGQDTQDAEAMGVKVPAPTEANPYSFDEYLKSLMEGYKDLKSQKEEDKYLALLAGGLGMMSGTSPFAAANIGAGGQQGIAAMIAANKERGAEKAALDRAVGQGLYRQQLANMTGNQRAVQNEIAQGNLALNQKKELDSQLTNIQGLVEKRALAALKTNGLIGLDTPPEEVATKVGEMAAKELARNKAYRDLYKQRWGYDYDIPAETKQVGGAGWSAKVK